MKGISLLLALWLLIPGVGCSQQNNNQPQANSGGASKQTGGDHQSKPSKSHSGSGQDAVFKNLQVYFINGEKRGQDAKYLPLAEAMEKGIARVNETGEVQNLTIENLSETEYVFVNAGDIVKGGRQDRYLVNSLIVPPNSGKIDLASFCVEAGRWSQRGRESAARFSASKFTAPSSDIKLAAQFHKNQKLVWDGVAQSRAYYSLAVSSPSVGSPSVGSPSVGSSTSGNLPSTLPVTVAAATTDPSAGILAPPAIPGDPNQTVIDPNTGLPSTDQRAQVASLVIRRAQFQQAASILAYSSLPGGSSSLQLALENPKVQELVKEYEDNMNRQLTNQRNPVGFAVAINGKIVGADVYGEDGLFKALWPKLINGAATEAVAKYDEKIKVKRLKQADFEAFLENKKQDRPMKKDLNDQTQLLTIKGDRHILFETRDKRGSKNWIHRNYLAAPEK
jgi:hypothetical protein